MSVIGPRPALWNQDVLTAERDKYGANDVKPGLTGWAQINGRDELEIPVKAKLDGEYVQKENLIVTENSEKRFKVFKCEQSISCFICGIVVPCYILLADDFIRIWLGSEYQLGFAMSCAVGLNMYLSCVMQPLWSYREATGLYRKTKWIMVICAMINIGLSIILGKTIGVIGIILASAIARIVVVSGHGLIQERKIGVDENGQPYPVRNYEVSGDKIEAIHMLGTYRTKL